jgi:hypothetical protein
MQLPPHGVGRSPMLRPCQFQKTPCGPFDQRPRTRRRGMAKRPKVPPVRRLGRRDAKGTFRPAPALFGPARHLEAAAHVVRPRTPGSCPRQHPKARSCCGPPAAHKRIPLDGRPVFGPVCHSVAAGTLNVMGLELPASAPGHVRPPGPAGAGHQVGQRPLEAAETRFKPGKNFTVDRSAVFAGLFGNRLAKARGPPQHSGLIVPHSAPLSSGMVPLVAWCHY